MKTTESKTENNKTTYKFKDYTLDIQSLLLRGVGQQIQQLAFPKLEVINHHYAKIGLHLVPMSAPSTESRSLADHAKLILLSNISAERKCDALTKLVTKND